MTGVTRADIQCGTVKVFKETRWNWNGNQRCVVAKLAASVEKSALNSICLTAFFLDNLGKSRHKKGKTILYFNKARDDGVAVASAGPYASRFRQITTPAPHRCIFTGRMLLLTSNQQCQSTEGNRICWFFNTSFNPQGCGHYSIIAIYQQHSTGCKTKPTARTVHMCLCIVHNCRTQQSTE